MSHGGGFAGGFSEGLLQTTEVLGGQRLSRERNEIARGQLGISEVRNRILARTEQAKQDIDLREQADSAIEMNLKILADAVKGFDAEGRNRSELEPLARNLFEDAQITLSMREKVFPGAPGAERTLAQRFANVLKSPTPEELGKQAANKERVVSEAKAEGQAAGGPLKTETYMLPNQVFIDVDPNNKEAVNAIVAAGGTRTKRTIQATTAADLLTGGGKRRVEEVRKSLRQIKGDMGEVNETLRAFAETPEAGGIIGGLIEKVGGVIQQIPGGGAALDVAGVDPAEVKAVRTQARATISRLLTTITQETSRFTDEERKLAKEVLAALSPDASFEQITAAGNTILGMMERSQAGFVQELVDASDADVSTEEGRTAIFNILKKNGFSDTESADLIIDLMGQ